MLFKTAIIDDSVVFSSFLQSVLLNSAHVHSAAVYHSAEDFLLSGSRHSYHLLFIDIGLPGKSGIELVKTLNQLSGNALTVFITGHPEFAPAALRLKVLDYLLKPVSEEEIHKTIAAARPRFKEVKKTSPGLSPGKLLLKTGREFRVIDQKDIIFIEKQGKSCVIHTSSGAIITAATLESLEKNLDQGCFYKSHRGFIINVKMVLRTERWADRAYKIKMYNTTGEPLLSRARFKNLESLLKVFQRNLIAGNAIHLRQP